MSLGNKNVERSQKPYEASTQIGNWSGQDHERAGAHRAWSAKSLLPHYAQPSRVVKGKRTDRYLGQCVRSEGEGPSSISKHPNTTASNSFLQFVNHPQLRAQIRKIMQEEARHICALQTDMYLLKAAQVARSDALQIGFESAKKYWRMSPSTL